MKNYNEIIKDRKTKIEEFIESPYYSNFMTESELAAYFETPAEEYSLFHYTISELINEGKLVLTKKEKLAPPAKMGYYKGILRTTEKGLGHVSCENLDEDIFVYKDDLNGAAHMDTVLISIAMYKGKPSGVVKKVLKRGSEKITGVYLIKDKTAYVQPDDKRLFKKIEIMGKTPNFDLDGYEVVVKITEPPNKKRVPKGKVVEILGKKGGKGVDVLSVMAENNIPADFPKKVKEEVKKIPMTIEGEDLTGREDFRSVQMVTIDGEDAKDLDDAVSCKVLENGNFELGVYIADVSHYVKENSPLDRETYQRGTSVYLPDRVIPMLPKELSNGICSLNEKQDRLALCCIMEINGGGRVVSHRTVKGVINVNRRMTYTVVYDLLTNENSEYKEEYAELIPMFKTMADLREILFEKRLKRGAIDFNFTEAKVILDDNGKCVDIVARARNTATSIIEEFMIAANETIAEEFFWQKVPFIYRSHEEPDDEKYEMLRTTVGAMGYLLKTGKKTPKNLQKLLDEVKGKPEETMINMLALRSMQQAKYTGDAMGHYGLASKFYCHFTSPIRRYPDLFIHRIISYCLEGTDAGELNRRFAPGLDETANLCSQNERRAEAAERESVEMKKAEYMRDKVGETFTGIISSVTPWGIYVRLPNTIEGMIPIKTLTDDRYIYNEESMSYLGERTHKTYKIGDTAAVILERASSEMRQIDFIFEENAEDVHALKPEKPEKIYKKPVGAKHKATRREKKRKKASKSAATRKRRF